MESLIQASGYAVIVLLCGLLLAIDVHARTMSAEAGLVCSIVALPPVLLALHALREMLLEDRKRRRR